MELVQPAAIEVLAAGPLTLAELTAALRDRGIFESVDEDAWNVEEIVDECLLTDGRALAAALAAVDAMFDRPHAGTQSDEL